MFKTALAALLLLVMLDSPRADMDYDYVDMVCMADSSGRTVEVHSSDTCIVVENVVKVVYKGGGYELTLKDERVRFFIRPPFRSVEYPVAEGKSEAGGDGGKRRRGRKK